MMTTPLPIIQPKRPTTKVKISPSLLPMFATICPFDIIGSEQSRDGVVVLVLEGNGLPQAEWSTIMCERKGNKSIVEIVGVNA
jgi:hypothetical protein